MGDRIKRERSTNFTKDEEEVLIGLVDRKREVIGSFKTDAVSRNQKKTAWDLMAMEFTALTGIVRSAKVLRKKHENIKRGIKIKEKSKIDDVISFLGTSQGLSNLFHSDRLDDLHEDRNGHECSLDIKKEQDIDIPRSDVLNWSPMSFKRPIDSESTSLEEGVSEDIGEEVSRPGLSPINKNNIKVKTTERKKNNIKLRINRSFRNYVLMKEQVFIEQKNFWMEQNRRETERENREKELNDLKRRKLNLEIELLTMKLQEEKSRKKK